MYFYLIKRIRLEKNLKNTLVKTKCVCDRLYGVHIHNIITGRGTNHTMFTEY